MANIDRLAPIIFKWEGGFANDKYDKGGATNMGVTISTWKQCGYDKDGDGDIDVDDLKQITKEDAYAILRKYWNRWKADCIRDQSVANILVDWVWGSGKWGIVIPQRMLGVKVDGIVGIKTIEAVNARNGRQFFDELWERRKKYFEDICVSTPTNARFLKGWLNRLNDFRYEM